MDSKEYFAIKAMSASGLKEFSRSPAHYKEYLEHPPEPTASMLFGTAVHTAILEPSEFFVRYAIAPECDKRTKEGKDIWAKFQALNEGKSLITQEQMTKIEAIQAKIKAHPIASKLLTGGKAEQSYFWNHKETGLACKARADYVREDIGLVVDLKTSQDASLQGFQRAISNFKYHLQSAWYLDGISQATGKTFRDFAHLVIEVEPPYGIAIYTLDDYSLNFARNEIDMLMRKYSECVALDRWTGYPQDVQNISIPNWMTSTSLD